MQARTLHAVIGRGRIHPPVRGLGAQPEELVAAAGRSL